MEAFAFFEQQIWTLRGTLPFAEGAIVQVLRRGDYLALGPPKQLYFRKPTAGRVRLSGFTGGDVKRRYQPITHLASTPIALLLGAHP